MPTITTVDATWTNGVAMDEAELRRADSAMFLGDGSSNGVRGGIVRHGANSLAVAVNGSDQVTVQAGAVVIPAATGLGVYRASLAAATTATAIDSRNATNPRIDLVVFRSTGAVDIITGTPGSSPSAPALPSGAVELARLSVPALGGGAVTVDNNFRSYAATLGGVLPVATAARLPGSGVFAGQQAIAVDTGTEHVWTGAAWRARGWTSYTPTLTNFSVGTGTVVARYFFDNGKVDLRLNLVGGTGSSASGPLTIGLPFPAHGSGEQGISVKFFGAGNNFGMGLISAGSSTMQIYFSADLPHATFASGNGITAWGAYEAG